jgi:hypothetical protein
MISDKLAGLCWLAQLMNHKFASACAKPINPNSLDDVSVREIHGRSIWATENRDQDAQPKRGADQHSKSGSQPALHERLVNFSWV